jgi:nitrite reductase/ring-hydroxylating ferredoxin subunit
VVLLVISGWLGGTLAYRNQIGVDHRYANKGKWSTTDIPNTATEIDVTGLEVDQMKLVFVGGKRIVLGRTESGYVAFDDRCTHRGGSLAGGTMICGTVQCPWHGSQFDCMSGAVKAGPATESIKTYQVQFNGSKALLRL